MNATHVVEEWVLVTSGSTICPHPALCDVRDDEQQDDYVTRHLYDHDVETVHPDTGIVYEYFSGFDETGNDTGRDARERNLALYCLFYYAKHVQGNRSLGVTTNTINGAPAILADYEPCWEDAFFLSNSVFHPDDLEQNTEWNQRTFRLKPYEEQRKDGAVYKRKKKLTKVRGTQKSSWVKAFITWKHLRAYFLFKNPTYRVLCISANKGNARDNYFEPLKTLWESNENLTRLFGTTTYTKRYAMLLDRRKRGKFVSEEELEAEKRQLCLLGRGSKSSIDRMRLRWNVHDKDSSGQTAVSLRCAGARSGTTGGRWDLVVVDDIVDLQNSQTDTQRKKIIGVVAELKKQATGSGEIVYVNTPFQTGDASELIDRDEGNDYHIMYRPAMWYDTSTKQPHYYWQRSAPTASFPEGETLWTPERIDSERKSPDFWSQIMLRLRSDNAGLFKREDFQIIDPADAPLEVRAGLGGSDVSDRDAALLARENRRRTRYTFVDPAGEEERAHGDDTAEISYAFDQYGSLYITHISGGRLTADQEAELVYEAWAYNDSQLIEFEVDSSLRKYVRATFTDFQRKKAAELGEPITMPIVYENASRSKLSKGERMDRMYTYTSTGRVFILKNAGPQAKIDLLIAQFVNRSMEPHDDYADAASKVVPYAARAPRKERPKDDSSTVRRGDTDSTTSTTATGTARVRISDLLASLESTSAQKNVNWGARRA